MSKLPVVSGKELCKALSKMGFQTMRQRGSHVVMQHPDGRSTVVPMHQQIGKGLLKRIMNEAEMDTEELIHYL